jgi:hypothetical protein
LFRHEPGAVKEGDEGCRQWKDPRRDCAVRLEHRYVTFTLEYEMTAKSEERYADILNDFDLEKNLDRFLYLASSEDVLRFVSWQFRNSKRYICFGLLADLYRRLLETEVFDWECHQYRPLRNALGSNTHSVDFPRRCPRKRHAHSLTIFCHSLTILRQFQATDQQMVGF